MQVLLQVESTDAGLAEVARMVLVEQDTHVVLTTRITSTIRMLSMFTYSTVPMGHVASHLPAFLVGAGHLLLLIS